MSVTIIFGGQFGSEGKGKVAHYFAKKQRADYCVRVGGSNSGHTVYREGEKLIFRILPTGVIENHVTAVLPAGSYINLSILKQEMEIAGLSKDRLLIDDNAVIISNDFKYGLQKLTKSVLMKLSILNLLSTERTKHILKTE